MFLHSISVLTYQPATPGSAPRLVDIGSAVRAPAVGAAQGRYQVLRLAPGPRVLRWQREGARFDLSAQGRVQVRFGQWLAASECPEDCRAPRVVALDQDEVAYLEAYLLARGHAWNSPDSAPARLPQ